jgi:hypothetical protein
MLSAAVLAKGGIRQPNGDKFARVRRIGRLSASVRPADPR